MDENSDRTVTGDADAQLKKAIALVELGQYTAARRLLRQIAYKDPGSIESREALSYLGDIEQDEEFGRYGDFGGYEDAGRKVHQAFNCLDWVFALVFVVIFIGFLFLILTEC